MNFIEFFIEVMDQTKMEIIGKIIIPAASLIVAVISIIISIRANNRSNKANKKHDELVKRINSKEYQLNENLKETAVQIIAAVRAIDAKAAMAFENENFSNKMDYTIDFSYEKELLSKLQSSPTYILFLKSIVDNEKRYYMERYIQALYMQISSKLELADYIKIRNWTNLIMKQLDYYIKYDHIDHESCVLIKDLCNMEGILTESSIDFGKEEN